MGADDVLPVDAGSFSIDFSSFSYYGCVVAVDPFSTSRSGDGVGVPGGGGMVEALVVVSLIWVILIGFVSVTFFCWWMVAL